MSGKTPKDWARFFDSMVGPPPVRHAIKPKIKIEPIKEAYIADDKSVDESEISLSPGVLSRTPTPIARPSTPEPIPENNLTTNLKRR